MTAGPPPVPGGRPGDDEVPLPPRRRRPRPSTPPTARGALPPRSAQRAPLAPRSRRRLILLGLGALLVIVAIWFLASLFQPLAGGGGRQVEVTIPRGSSVGKIADALASRGVVSSAFFFQARATIEGRRADLKSGTYSLRHDMSYSAALAALVKGPAPNVVTVTIPEGRSRAEIARALKPGKLTGDYLSVTRRSATLDPASYGAKAASNLEGFLFPNTYQLKRGASTTALVDKQLSAFRKQFAAIDLGAARRAGLSAYDVVVIASLIEREAEVQSERATIASVIYNRLRANMPLGIDATTRFATGNWTRPLTASELAIRSPYNTRIHPGLPPGPIGNPGLASLVAAARPAATQYVYYVANPCRPGTHSFSTTAAQFNADAARYQAARSRSGGKAPTGC